MVWNRGRNSDKVVQEFRLALRRATADQVVAEAERTVRGAWGEELALARAELRVEHTQAQAARAVAWAAVHDRRRAGDVAGLAEARRELSRTNAGLGQLADAERALAAIEEEELELMDLADEEADLIATANRIRLRVAWEEMRATWREPGSVRVRKHNRRASVRPGSR